MIENRSVAGWPGYAVSSTGIVFGTSGPLKASLNNSGYPTVVLSKKKACSSVFVHRIVATAFHGDGAGRTVNHRNGIKTDNRACNLQWVTQSENVKHAYATGLRKPLRGYSHPESFLTPDIIAQILSLKSAGMANRKIARKLGCGSTTVFRAYSGQTWLKEKATT